MGSAKPAAVRLALIEAAAHIIATEGVAALTLRRVADDVGTSTMAVYTHFGGMPELRRAVRREGFARLAARLLTIARTKDPVADLGVLGLAYYANATDNPELYRVMFMEQPIDDVEAGIGWDTFDSLVAGVRRCLDAGRFAPADERDLATQLWALAHGMASLRLARLLDPAQAFAGFGGAALGLFTSYGDDRASAQASLQRALQRSSPAKPGRARRQGQRAR